MDLLAPASQWVRTFSWLAEGGDGSRSFGEVRGCAPAACHCLFADLAGRHQTADQAARLLDPSNKLHMQGACRPCRHAALAPLCFMRILLSRLSQQAGYPQQARLAPSLFCAQGASSARASAEQSSDLRYCPGSLAAVFQVAAPHLAGRLRGRAALLLCGAVA